MTDNLHPLFAAIVAAHFPTETRTLSEPDQYGRRTYGDWTIYYEPPPIPVRTMDWHFVHRDYDAETDSEGCSSDNGLSGSAGSVFECLQEITEIELDKGMA